MKTLQCVFNGEFGWEVLHWQGYCRKLSRHFERTYFVSINKSTALYEDFAKEGLYETSRTVASQQYTIIPFEQQEFIKFGSPKEENFDILVHAREGRFEYRNYPQRKWETIVKACKEILRCSIASIGTKARHIEGTEDLRHIDLKDQMDYMAGAKCIVGPSSGPMHLADFCGCKRVVWGDSGRWIGNLTLRERYEGLWSPFKIETVYLEDDNWEPEPELIFQAVEKILYEKSMDCHPKPRMGKT